MTRIVFMGTPDFSVPILRMLHEEGYDLLAAVTQPDRPVGRKRVLTPPPVKEEALRLGLPVIQPGKLKGSEELNEILSMEPDLIITAAFGQILPNELLDAPPLGCLNVHASLLPEYRGGAPIHQAIIDGREETGVTIMYMAEKLDAGDIISQVRVPIGENDNTGELFDRLSEAGTILLKETLPSVIAGTNERIPQDHEKATFAGNIKREQERIDWMMPGNAVHNQIRGLSPWPVAYTELDGKPVKIWRAEKAPGKPGASAGEIISVDDGAITVQAGDGTSVRLLELQPSGKKRMEARGFLNGAGSHIKAGDRFE
ncbi:methionyl-tRNA formyltransferase [Bhargavaea beijingensis]|uniref:Methionyl-tRNA formyltransferase n=1 Tax=Bhargavaea beijingensis TaxID=426756 RepID=A0A1G7C8L7_9BACL|nr:methionyl-tRNA formyltransferase [Bhargavaea beijingensis]MCW1926889.1 methionyl-tRNA formyltransferase [Bhargavaea beijingensis]RSK36867.1 methionyl-tRNA formyltransferase [Bhargavaea beijingensis]SDE35681.1 methionyl-tRNA formyltransferase [Bhargavaea beijingensis]